MRLRHYIAEPLRFPLEKKGVDTEESVTDLYKNIVISMKSKKAGNNGKATNDDI
jgi:hypothetical protein